MQPQYKTWTYNLSLVSPFFLSQLSMIARMAPRRLHDLIGIIPVKRIVLPGLGAAHAQT